MRFPVSDLPNKALLMEMLEQVVARKQTTALMIITCETLRDTAGVLKEAQREILLLTLVEKLKSVLSPRMILAQISVMTLLSLPTVYRNRGTQSLWVSKCSLS
ncbi:putative diguanylate cyclase [Escherichia coli]|uniref:Putative diguanylate cyclase n=1 Tax=Escherichia coli TaxID=562 RepID=A0A376MKL1_ECOLX|nr:putative diguanylate cyclase [Escherichia coli]